MNIPGINEIVKQMQGLDEFKAELAVQMERIATAAERIADSNQRLVELAEAREEGISV